MPRPRRPRRSTSGPGWWRGASSARPDPARRGGVHQEHDRIAQPGGAQLGPGQPAGGRRRPADRDGAPLQHRPLDDHLRGARRARHPLHPDRRLRAPRARRSGPAGRRRQARRHLGHVQRARHDQRSALCRRGGAPRRGDRGGRRRPARPPRPGRRHRAGADFLAFSAHKTMGPTGIGVLWVAPSCSTPWALSSAVAG